MISKTLIQINMNCYCSVCDKTIELEPKSNHFKSLTCNHYEKFIQTNHTIKNPIFFSIDTIFINYITHQNKKLELYLVRADFNLDFDNDLNAHMKIN